MTTPPLPWASRAMNLVILPILVAYFGGGVVSWWTGTPNVVETHLGTVFEAAWLLMLMGGPILSVAGMLSPNPWVGTWLRLAGSWACTGALATFWMGLQQRFGGDTFTVWAIGGLTVTTALVAAISGWQLYRFDRLVASWESGGRQ